MCYACLSVLNNIISEDKIKKLKEYFLSLTPNNRDLITVSKISRELEVDAKTAVEIILKCEEEGVLQRHFGIRCPSCGMLIKDIPGPSLDGISIDECYSCDEEISIDEKDIVILFKLIKVEIPFDHGQQGGQSAKKDASIVAREDTLECFKIMCEAITQHCDAERLKAYNEKINSDRMKAIHNKAVKISERNRKINIVINIVCLIIGVAVIRTGYVKFGFSKLSMFISFIGFAVPFVCNYIFKDLLPTDINRLEEKVLLKESC